MNERSAEPAIFPPPGERTLVWAHRGYMSRAPQNTLAAFALAWEAGADGIELDAQRSADGHAVVFHDDTLDRLTDGTGAVADRPLEYLRSLDAGSRFSGSFAGERIPLLAEVLSGRPKEGYVNVEIKTPLASIPTLARLGRLFTGYPAMANDGETERGKTARLAAECVAETVRAAAARDRGLRARLIVSSFDPVALARFSEILPEVPVGFLYCGNTKRDTRPLAFGTGNGQRGILPVPPAAFHPAVRETSPSLIRREHAAGRRVHVWTVRNDLDALWLARSGADALIGNDPARMLAALRRAGLR